MPAIHTSSMVRLVRGIPSMRLPRNEVGVVQRLQSVGASSVVVCEVEFQPSDRPSAVRAMLLADELRLIQVAGGMN